MRYIKEGTVSNCICDLNINPPVVCLYHDQIKRYSRAVLNSTFNNMDQLRLLEIIDCVEQLPGDVKVALKEYLMARYG